MMGKWSPEARANAAAKRAVRRPRTEQASDYGPKFRAAREAAGLTAQEAFAASGVAVSAIHYYETGQREPTLTSAKKLADVYGVSLDALAGR